MALLYRNLNHSEHVPQGAGQITFEAQVIYQVNTAKDKLNFRKSNIKSG